VETQFSTVAAQIGTVETQIATVPHRFPLCCLRREERRKDKKRLTRTSEKRREVEPYEIAEKGGRDGRDAKYGGQRRSER
jgi:hypothetical protein